MVDDSIWISVARLTRNTAKHWLLTIGGAVASLVGWILQANGGTYPTRYFVWAGAALIVVAMVRAYHELRMQHDQLAEDRKPKLDIVFLPQNNDDSRPYLQSLQFAMRVAAGFPNDHHVKAMLDRRYRIGVSNLSTATVPDVSVKLESCTPPGNFIHVGHHLLVMDSDPPAAYRDLPPSVAGEPTLWFDVVSAVGELEETPVSFMFCFANPNIRGGVNAGQTYEIVLRAEGGNVSTSRSFRIQMLESADMRLTMTPL